MYVPPVRSPGRLTRSTLQIDPQVDPRVDPPLLSEFICLSNSVYLNQFACLTQFDLQVDVQVDPQVDQGVDLAVDPFC